MKINSIIIIILLLVTTVLANNAEKVAMFAVDWLGTKPEQRTVQFVFTPDDPNQAGFNTQYVFNPDDEGNIIPQWEQRIEVPGTLRYGLLPPMNPTRKVQRVGLKDFANERKQ